ncbi:phosphoribosylformylglycinamidine cyclo-ligase [Aureliella helgolandensis]|uniref:Phosphoribosylformylglycinamidine cyclo-ligase n=1 Tax=Aureliella helgolandensis TaxID=2527968 RepID=A0A518G0H7_9BACT|nr:phosphoribosylformylglycinamidine cyclo-ligase [Aureliella helgolandensis]QDV22108.1 Phosphoribosylformylglycinamidine cyclo-ligase [Aureliella helgolandensis]
MSPITYKDSGVDLELYEQSMQRLPKLMHRTFSPRVMKNDGGFAGLFQLDFNNALFSRKYEEPILVSGTDGVGTKLKVAQLLGRHDTVGIDLVAMCVNDILCCGAEPLFFLDYVAMSRDNPPLLEQIVAGISQGCIQGDCSLLGGETAIMPDLYNGDDYDLAGFCVGVVEKKQLISGKQIAPDDVVIGIQSSGFHSNGYSLIRKAVFEKAGLSVDDPVKELGQTVGEALMTPTIIYSNLTQKILRHYKVKHVVHGIGHITGGGLLENTERILPPNVDLVFERNSWEIPPMFNWVQQLGQIADEEMAHIFNMGIGLTLMVNPYYANTILEIAQSLGLKAWTIGRAQAGSGKSRWK